MTKSKMALSAKISVAALAVFLSACGSDDVVMAPPVVVQPTPTPSPTATQMPTSFDVTPCLEQIIPGAGVSVAEAVVPDTVTINLAAASGFPNGRRLEDPVIDVTLGVIFLDLTTQSPAALVGTNPAANDLEFQNGFPFLAPAQGDRVMTTEIGTDFTFNEMREFVTVDRMGMPAVATVLIGSDRRNEYNDSDPAVDATGEFVPDLAGSLTALTNALADDIVGAGLTPCAVENT